MSLRGSFIAEAISQKVGATASQGRLAVTCYRKVEQVRRFYRLFHAADFAWIVDEPAPRYLVGKYARLGLPAKADAFIGAFAEWMEVRCLISDNRHYLRELQASTFVSAASRGISDALARRQVVRRIC